MKAPYDPDSGRLLKWIPFLWAGSGLLLIIASRVLTSQFLFYHPRVRWIWKGFADMYGLSLPAVRLALLLLGLAALAAGMIRLIRHLGGTQDRDSERWQSRGVFLLLVLFITAGFSLRLTVSWQDMELLTGRVLIDDTFYSFEVARNLSLGKGLSHDGVTSTNGVQPLLVFIMAAVFKLAGQGRDLPVHIFLTLMSCLSVFSMILLYRIVSRLTGRRGALFAVFLWALSPFMIKTELNGLETGLAAFFLLFSFYYYLKKIRVPGAGEKKHFIFLGCLLGLGILSRIDTGFFTLALGLDYLWISRGRWTWAFKRLMLAAGVTFLIAAPWFIYNMALTGHPMPVSGRAVNFLSRVYGYHAFGSDYLHLDNPPGFPDSLPPDYYGLNFLYALKAIFMPQPLLKIFPFGLQGKIIGAMTLLCLALTVRGRGRKEPGFSLLRAPGLYLVFLILAYALFIFGQWFFQRYFFPATAIGVMAGGLLFSFAVGLPGPRVSWSKRAGFIAAGAVSILLFMIFASGIRRQFFPDTSQPPSRYHGMAVWTAAHTEENAVIGAFQAGMMAYFTPREVICLDGVVNAEALESLKEKEIDRYILEKGIDYLMDWAWVLEDLYAGRSSSPDPYQHLAIVHDGFFRVYRVREGPAP